MVGRDKGWLSRSDPGVDLYDRFSTSIDITVAPSVE